MAIKEKYVQTIDIFHKAKEVLTAGEPVALDSNGEVIPATATNCFGLSAQNVIAKGFYGGSAHVSLDSVTYEGRVGEPVGVYKDGGTFLTDMIQDATVAVNDKLYVDTVNRKLVKTNPGTQEAIAVVEAVKDANGFALVKLLV